MADGADMYGSEAISTTCTEYYGIDDVQYGLRSTPHGIQEQLRRGERGERREGGGGGGILLTD